MTRLITHLFLGGVALLTGIAQAATLIVLDVGEGQAVLIKDGDEAMLVDTGHAGAAPAVLESLMKYEVTTLKAIVLTHLHPDHASGWFRLREAFPEASTLYSGHKVSSLAFDDISRWIFEAITNDLNYREIRMGDSVSVGRCSADVIWPMDPEGLDLNKNSIVLTVNCGGDTALLMADANRDVEHKLLLTDMLSEKTGLLVVGHHGASDATSIEFLTKILPTYSAISVNENNLRGYPAEGTMQSLQKSGTTILRTDLFGDLCFQLDERALNIPCKAITR